MIRFVASCGWLIDMECDLHRGPGSVAEPSGGGAGRARKRLPTVGSLGSRFAENQDPTLVQDTLHREPCDFTRKITTEPGMESPRPSAQRRPAAPCVQVTPDISVQPPLSRRGSGPGLLLVVLATLDLTRHEKTLDPPPLKKWAEEGYAVAQILVGEDRASSFADQLGTAISELEKLHECSGDKFGLVGMETPSSRRIISLHPVC